MGLDFNVPFSNPPSTTLRAICFEHQDLILLAG